MHDILPYDRGAAVRYAHRWAYDRNPAYYDFSELGETVPTSHPNAFMLGAA